MVPSNRLPFGQAKFVWLQWIRPKRNRLAYSKVFCHQPRQLLLDGMENVSTLELGRV